MTHNPDEVTQRFRRLLESDQSRPAMTLEFFRNAGLGHLCAVVCRREETQDAVIEFAIRQTEVSGWLVQLGYPKFSNGVYVWALAKP